MNPKPGPDGTCSVRQARPRSKRPRSFGSRGFGRNAPLQHGDCEKVSSCNDSQFGFHKARALSTSRTRSNYICERRACQRRSRPRRGHAAAARAALRHSACACGRRADIIAHACGIDATMLPLHNLYHAAQLHLGAWRRASTWRRCSWDTPLWGQLHAMCRRVCGDATRCTGCTAPFSSTIADRANAVRLYDGLVLRRPGPRAAVARPAAVRVRRFPPRAWCARRLEPGALTARTC